MTTMTQDVVDTVLQMDNVRDRIVGASRAKLVIAHSPLDGDVNNKAISYISETLDNDAAEMNRLIHAALGRKVEDEDQAPAGGES